VALGHGEAAGSPESGGSGGASGRGGGGGGARAHLWLDCGRNSDGEAVIGSAQRPEAVASTVS
jgi:hypothetical protein